MRDHALSNRAIALVGAVVALLFIGLASTRTWQALELKGFDTLTVATSPNASSFPITIVGIDEQSMAELGRQWPWPRDLYARLLDVLREDGAVVVVFDVLFSEPDAGAASNDTALAEAIRRHGNVVMAADRVYMENAYSRQWMRLDPLPLFKQAGATTGYARVQLDPDLVAREMPREDDALWRQVLRLLKQRMPGIEHENPPAGSMIRYAGPFQTFQYVPFYAALDRNLLKPGVFKDQVIIICRHLAASPEVGAAQADLFVTPFTASTGLFTPGGELHAHILETVLRGDAIKPSGFAWQALLVAAVCALGAVGMRRWRPVLSGLVAAGIVLATAALAWALFRQAHVWIPAISAMAAVATLYVAYGAIAFLAEAHRRSELRRAFSLYLSPEVVDHVMAHPERLRLGGERRDVTMMFTDLAGFTTITEQQGAEQVARVLNMHFTRVTSIVKKHGGTVNRFIGDAVMGMWGAPMEDADQALHALQAACEAQEDMERLREELKRLGLPPIWMRIGIHACNAIVGNLGSSDRFDYTAIGDGVNLAARLEGVNKLYGTGILTSGETVALLAGRLPMRVVDRVIVKGKTEPVDLYTPCADAEVVQWSAQGMAAYRERRWDESEACWRRVRSRMPHDRVAEIHLERLAALKAMPPNTQWRDAVELEKL